MMRERGLSQFSSQRKWDCPPLPRENTMTHEMNTAKPQAPGRTEAGYRAALQLTVAACVFLAVVAATMLWDYSRRLVKDPLDSEDYVRLKAQLEADPTNDAIKDQIRTRDAELRSAYFSQRSFAQTGGWLLFAAAWVALIASRIAVTLRRKLPLPVPQPSSIDPEIRTLQMARWAVGAVLGLLLGTGAVLAATARTPLSANDAELAALLHPAATSDSTAIATAPNTPAPAPTIAATPAAAGDYPSDAEVAKNWPRFRGPGGTGVSDEPNLPTAWDVKTNKAILWKTPVPLPGHNSPIVWNDRVFLSGADKDHRKVLCFDAASGKLLWQGEVPKTTGTPAGLEIEKGTSYAAPSMVTDGRRAYAIFPTGDVVAFDFSGKLAWVRGLGKPKSKYGYASSLAMYQNRLLIQFDQGEAQDGTSKLIALEASSGKTVWEAPRPVGASWSSPIVIRQAGRDQVVTTADPWAIAYDAADGKELWRADVLGPDQAPSPIFANGIVYVVSPNGRPALSAIAPDGQGNVTAKKILWKGEDNLPDITSPLATAQYVFLLPTSGMLTSYEAKHGKKLWEQDLYDLQPKAAPGQKDPPSLQFESSPSMAGNRLYLISTAGKCWVLECNDQGCKPIGTGDLDDECHASPAFHDGRMFVRGEKNLYCIGFK